MTQIIIKNIKKLVAIQNNNENNNNNKLSRYCVCVYKQAYS